MKIIELEQKIMELEEFRVVIRAPSWAEVDDYPYARKADKGSSLTNWCHSRLEPLLKDGMTYVVLDGNCGMPHGRTKLSTLRATYER